MKGISIHGVMHTIHMTLDMARLRGWIVDALIRNLAKYFGAIAQEVHRVVGTTWG